MDFHLRIEIQNGNITVFMEKKIFVSKKQLQIENSGFLKTCHEYVHMNQIGHQIHVTLRTAPTRFT